VCSTKNNTAGVDLNRFAQIFLEQATTHRWQAVKLAYSGGVDSQALLHILVELRSQLSLDILAIHINHGMHPQADDWEQFCRDNCDRLEVKFASRKVVVDPVAHGPEAAARAARYSALASFVAAGDVLLTAHHQDDQAETFLLQLMRGAGAAGLASMPLVGSFSAGHHFRPLLDFSRKQIHQYAASKCLSWVEDPSNFDIGVRRSFLRQRLVPLLQQAWPRASAMIARSTAHVAEANALLAELASLDLAHCVGEAGEELSLAKLSRLSPPRLRNLLRTWIRIRGYSSPSVGQLEQICHQVYAPSATAQAKVRWGNATCYRYRDRLWVQPWEPRRSLSTLSCDWDLASGPLSLPQAGIELFAQSVTGQGLAKSRIRGAVQVGFRSGGEGCKLPGHRHQTTLKNLFQQGGVPPWERDRTPLIFIDGELAAVGNRWVCEPFGALENEPAWRVEVAKISQK